MSSGLAGRGATATDVTVKKSPAKVVPSASRLDLRQAKRLVEYRCALAVRYREEFAFGGDGRAQAEDGEYAPRRQCGQRRQLLGNQHGMAPWQHHHRRSDFESARAGQGVRHADERVDGLGVHQLGEPQRVDPQPLELVDEFRQLVGTGVCAKPDAETDLHRRSTASVAVKLTSA